MNNSIPNPENKMGNTTRAVGELLPEIRAGNPVALNELVTIAYQRLEGIIRGKKYKFSGSRNNAVRGDVQTGIIVSDLFLRLSKAVTGHKLSDLNHPAGFWKIAADNVMFILLDIARKRKRPSVDCEAELAESRRLGPESMLERTEVLQAVEELPEELRTVIKLYYYLGRSQSEISDILVQDDPRMHERQVSRILAKAKTKLAEKLAAYDPNSDTAERVREGGEEIQQNSIGDNDGS